MFKPLQHCAIGLAALALSAGAVSAPSTKGADKNQFKAHLHFLADDSLEGRGTGTRGYDIAANYVASQFTQFGLLPRGDKGYLQPVTFKVTRLAPDSAVLELQTKDGVQKLVHGEEFAMSGALMEDQSSVSAPLVFVGYGIDAPMFQHRDYEGLDVKGKIVVFLYGGPSTFPTEEGAHFSHPGEKRLLAAKHGAVGMIQVQTPRAEKRYPFAASSKNTGAPIMSWNGRDGQPGGDVATLQNRATVSMQAAKKLFAQSGLNLDEILAASEADKPIPRGDLKISASMAKKSTRTDLASSNVVGMIEGSDPQLKNEYVVFSAHLDHLGTNKEKTGDNLYNGAMDNASGVATLIETARMFSALPVKPKRSILFVALTAEEKGLLGSDFFARNPPVPVKSIVANINLDMPILSYDFDSVIAFGAEHSSLKTATSNAVKKMNLTLGPDPFPEQGLFTRSDHYNFVKQGVPSIFLMTGMTSFNKKEDGKAVWKEFLAKHYHKPSDDLTLPFNFDAAVRFVNVNYQIGLEVANAKARPTWNKGDFFGDTFSK